MLHLRIAARATLCAAFSAFAIGLACWPGEAMALDWTVEKIVDQGAQGGTSLALDQDDRPHIVYEDTSNPLTDFDLKYVRWTGSEWAFETIDSGAGNWGTYTSLVLDSSGAAHVAYGHGGSVSDPYAGPRYAVRTPSGWASETIPTYLATGQYTSLALDSNDTPHVAYSGTRYDLEMAVKTGGSWSRKKVHDVSDVVGTTSIAMDGQDHPHIAYAHRGDQSVNYAAWTGFSWDRRQIESGQVNSANELALALASDGTPYVAYQAGGPKLAVWNGTGWDIDQIEPIWGWSMSLALDGSDRPHVVYFDRDHSLVKYATRNGANWDIETIESGWYDGQGASIAVDGKGHVHVTWYDSDGYSLRYAVGVPEPAALSLLAMGGLAVLCRRRRLRSDPTARSPMAGPGRPSVRRLP